MRLPLLAVALVLLATRAVPAQQPLKQPMPSSTNLQQQAAELQSVLLSWQKALSGVNKFHVEQASRTMKDVIFSETTHYLGDIKFQAPRQFLVHLTRVDKGKYVPGDFFRVVCTGKASYQFAPKEKVIFVLPLPDKQSGDETIMGFLFPDMKMTEFQGRYQLALAPPPAGYEKYYYFIDIVPTKAEDKQVFSRARLLLNRHNFLPRQLYYVEPNGNQITWDFPKIKTTDASVQPREFDTPTLPARDWSFRQQPVGGPPPVRGPMPPIVPKK
jgi:TIGR03009 family protein